MSYNRHKYNIIEEEEEEAGDNSGSDVKIPWLVYEAPLVSVLSRYEQKDCLLSFYTSFSIRQPQACNYENSAMCDVSGG